MLVSLPDYLVSQRKWRAPISYLSQNGLCLFCVWLLCAGWCETGSAADRPLNLILIVADDLGWSDLACYGSDLHRSPNLDALADQGVRFTQAYSASPVCSPTRASIMTGRHPARLHMTIWRESALNRGKRRLLEPVALGDLPLSEWTLAEAFRQAGYRTAHIGKWHLGQAESYPEAHGFDINIGGTLWGAPQSFFHPFSGDSYFNDWRYVPGLEPSEPGDYLTDRLTDRAIETIDSFGDRPFFLNLWYHSVHTPIEGKPELVERYRPLALKASIHRNPHYAAMVESLDENVGRVLSHLEAQGLDETTAVIFLSDNGGFVNSCKLHPDLAVTNNAPLRSGKGSCYEGGIRIPMIMKWPGVSGGRVSQEPIVTYDLFPTLVKRLGLLPAMDITLDGLDISYALDGATTTAMVDQPRELYFHYPHYYATTTPVSAMRSGKWKLLSYYEDRRVELYDLERDPSEMFNLNEQEPEIADKMLRKIEWWRQSVDAQAPEVNPDFESR